MLKPDSLRAHLTAALPQLAADPDKLLVFIDNGSLAATAAPALAFEYRYTLQIILQDYAGHPDAVMVPLLVWLARHQHELLANPDLREQIQFDADILAGDLVDLEIRLPLTERVGVHPRPGGGFDVEHYPEPELEQPLDAAHWRVYLRDELIAEWHIDG